MVNHMTKELYISELLISFLIQFEFIDFSKLLYVNKIIKVVDLLKSAKGPVKLVVLYSPQVLENMERRFEELRLSRKQQR